MRADVAGVVFVSGEEVRLERAEARTLQLTLGEDAAPLRRLSGCSLSLQGRRLGRRLWVSGWGVDAAWDGSTPYVGELLDRGGDLLIIDHNTEVAVVLEAASAAAMAPWAGEVVMVVGPVVGPQVVQVMEWWPLTGPTQTP